MNCPAIPSPVAEFLAIENHVNVRKKQTVASVWFEQKLVRTRLPRPHGDPKTHASWVNLAECFFSILTRQGLQHAVHRSVKELTRFLDAFARQYNKTCGPFIWTKGPEKLKRIIELTKAYQESLHIN